MELKTPLYEEHVSAGGKMVPFAGYLLPVQYESGVIAEHRTVREEAGLFDVSHMGEILCEGKDAAENLQRLLTNRFDNMKGGQAKYSPLCKDDGGMLDDLIVYCRDEEHYMLVVNAANREKDFEWMKAHAFGEAAFTDASDDYAQLALQGPKAMEILRKLTPEEYIPLRYYHAVFDARVADIPCMISTTGYTGEQGVELYLASEKAIEVWEALLEAGKEEGLIPCGLGARDTLRLEAGMPLYGNDMDETVNPLEADLGFAVKMQKEDFIGKQAMEKPLTRKRVGFKVTGRGIVREHTDVFSGDQSAGHVTSGTHLPYLGYAGGMAMLDLPYTEPGTKLEAEVRGHRIGIEVVPLPLYKRKN